MREKVPHNIVLLVLISIFISSFNTSAYAREQKVLRTNYFSIHYSDIEDLNDFFWRISGKRFEFKKDIDEARHKADRIVDRVESILDMHPPYFHVDVLLYAEYKGGNIAQYSPMENTIVVYVDKLTDGVLAHEVAHAVICDYFDAPPPGKTQEILTQYVDKYLWEDY